MSDLPEKVGPVPVDKPWHQLREFMTKKAGPLPVWAWALAAGGVIFAVVAMKGNLPGIGALSGTQGTGTAPDLGGGAGGDWTTPPPAPPPVGGGGGSANQPPPVVMGSSTTPLVGQQGGEAAGGIAPTAGRPDLNYAGVPFGIASRRFYDPSTGSSAGGATPVPTEQIPQQDRFTAFGVGFGGKEAGWATLQERKAAGSAIGGGFSGTPNLAGLRAAGHQLANHIPTSTGQLNAPHHTNAIAQRHNYVAPVAPTPPPPPPPAPPVERKGRTTGTQFL